MNNNIVETICGSPEDPKHWIYRNEKGMYVRNANIKSKKGGKPVRVLAFADVHLNLTNEDDIDNDEIMLTVTKRHWNAGGISVRALRRAMKHGEDFDKTVICGDIMDYLSHGAMELMANYLWKPYPNTIAAIGGHDLTREMQTGIPDKTTLESRYDIVKGLWGHDVIYYSEVLANKVMLIQLDNNKHRYYKEQAEKLERDIKIARENDYIILIFEHEPITTGDPNGSCVEAIIVCDRPVENFYDKPIGYPETSNEITMNVYNLITKNADVVKGVFCGHVHSGYYVDINGSYIDENGETIPSKIPQYVMEGLVYHDYVGHVMEITIE